MNATCAALLVASLSVQAELPLVMQRYRGTQTADPKTWEGTFQAIKANPGVADDVWFSTGIGYPPLDWHRRHAAFLGACAANLRTIGVVPSLQLQATLGHGDSISAAADCSSKTWGGFTGADGTETKYCSCPRQRGIIDYFVEVGRIYAAWKPHTIWVDDDLRMHNHNPVKEGCWCKTCVDAFARREGKAWTRETLVKACAADSALNERWRAFGEHSLVEFIEKVIAAVHAVSPETRFGLQCGYDGAHNRALLKAMSDGTGHPAAIRIGGGAYSDRDPFAVVRKAFELAGALNLIRDYDFMGAICPEVENCPRSYGCKTPRGTCVESLLALAQGYNAISIFATDADLETPEWYSTHIYSEIAAAHPVFEAYAKAAVNTAPAGFFYPGFYFDKYDRSKLVGPESSLVSIGLPVVPAPGRYYGLILDARVMAARTDAELKRLLKDAQSIILDGKAAEALVKRGFSAELGGLTARPSGVKRPGFFEAEGFRNETFTSDPLNRGCGVRHNTYCWSGYVVDFAEVAAKRVLGEYHRRDGSLGGFGTVLATLKDGRRIAVLGYSGFVDKFVSSGRLLQLQHIADWAAGGKLPLVLEDGALACTGVRVRDDGSFAAATVLNTTIGRQAPLKVRIRGLKPGVDRLMFRAFDRTPEALPVVSDGADAIVVIPALDAWNCAVITEKGCGASAQNGRMADVPRVKLGNEVPDGRPNVRWRGFNLLEMFHKGHNAKPKEFREEDFQIIHDWGFNFVRLPMDYRFWIQDGDWEKFDEDALKYIDRAIALGRKYGVHVSINMHRCPGYTVSRPKEERDLFTDSEAQRVCAKHWAMFARRYRGIPNDALSFNLFNEPPATTDEAYGRVARMLVDAIRAEDSSRFIIADGLAVGREPVPSLYGCRGVGQATRGYTPMSVSHYLAPWVGTPSETPVWPLSTTSPSGTMGGSGKKGEGMFHPFVLENVPAGTLSVEYGRISGPVTITFEADGVLVKSTSLVPSGESPLWSAVKKFPEWNNLVQARYNGVDTLTFSKPVKRFVIRVAKGDWARLSQIRLTSADGSHTAVLPIIGGWGKPKHFSQRFVGWGDTAFRATDVPEKASRYADAGQDYLYENVLAQWDEPIRNGTFVYCGEFGVWKMTPHAIVLDIFEDYLRLWKERNMGWALWNLRGTNGVLDSERQDVVYEDFRGHKLDRKMLELLQRY